MPLLAVRQPRARGARLHVPFGQVGGRGADPLGRFMFCGGEVLLLPVARKVHLGIGGVEVMMSWSQGLDPCTGQQVGEEEQV